MKRLSAGTVLVRPDFTPVPDSAGRVKRKTVRRTGLQVQLLLLTLSVALDASATRLTVRVQLENGIGHALRVRIDPSGVGLVREVQAVAGTEAVVEEVKKKGRRAKAFRADVSDRKATRKMIDEAISDFGTIQILVNNAQPVEFDEPLCVIE